MDKDLKVACLYAFLLGVIAVLAATDVVVSQIANIFRMVP